MNRRRIKVGVEIIAMNLTVWPLSLIYHLLSPEKGDWWRLPLLSSLISIWVIVFLTVVGWCSDD